MKRRTSKLKERGTNDRGKRGRKWKRTRLHADIVLRKDLQHLFYLALPQRGCSHSAHWLTQKPCCQGDPSLAQSLLWGQKPERAFLWEGLYNRHWAEEAEQPTPHTHQAFRTLHNTLGQWILNVSELWPISKSFSFPCDWNHVETSSLQSNISLWSEMNKLLTQMGDTKGDLIVRKRVTINHAYGDWMSKSQPWK